MDTIGHHADETIRVASTSAKLTLAAWGDNKLARAGRSRAVYPLLDSPVCVGTSKNGEPLHPPVPTRSKPAHPLQPV